MISESDTALTLHAKMRDAANELLRDLLPKMKNASLPLVPQKESEASYFGRRTADDGAIDWQKSASAINNLVRAVTEPYPGAFSYLGQRKLIIWRSRPLDVVHSKLAGTVLSTSPLVVACGDGALEIITGQGEEGLYVQGSRLAQEMGIVTGIRLGNKPSKN